MRLKRSTLSIPRDVIVFESRDSRDDDEIVCVDRRWRDRYACCQARRGYEWRGIEDGMARNKSSRYGIIVSV